MKKLTRFRDFIAEEKGGQLRRYELAELLMPELRSFKQFVLSEADGDEYHASLKIGNGNPQFSTEFLRRDREAVRNKRRRKITKLPVDLTKSGEFPEKPNESYEQRLHNCIMMLEHLNEIERPIVEAQCRRLMRAAHKSNLTLDMLARNVGAQRFSKMMTMEGEAGRST